MHWMSVSVYAGVLVVSTLVPWNNPGLTIFRIDMVLHFVAWAVLAFLTTIAWAKTLPLISAVALTAIAASCFGALLEALQPLVGRSAETLDLAADALGAILGAIAAGIAAWRSRQRAYRRRDSG